MQPAYKTIIAVIMICLSSFSLRAKDTPDYSVDKIPAELKKNANAVVRTNEVILEIVSESKANHRVKYAITIFKENALSEALFTQMYDKFIKLNNIEGTIYDGNGKRVKRIKNEDIKDYSAIQGFSLYEDNRIKAIDPEYRTFPFTIEYTYSIDYKSLFFIPSWYAFPGYNVSVEQSSFTVISPINYKLHFNELNIKHEAEVTKGTEQKTHKWQIENFAAIDYEPFSPNPYFSHPCIQLEPSKFNINNYQGDFSTWEDMGKFMCKLNKDMDVLSDETKNEILELVKDAKNEQEKVALIYQYSQKKNRYISVQVGIGGWQPFPADKVDRLSYGDCKALTNYTKALLKVAGIKSNYTLVNAGSSIRPISPAFSGNNFNHAFLCVPLDNDTIWLECTSSSSPCGYISNFTDDRNVLLITEDSGKLVKTPAYTAEQNRQSTNCQVQFSEDNNLMVNATINYGGARYGKEYRLLHKDEKDRRKAIINRIDIPNFKLIDYKLTDNSCRKPVLTKSIQLEATNYCTTLGERKILKLNLLNAFNGVPNYARKRRNPVNIQRYYSECDTITYELPSNLKVEALPKEKVLETKYGTYKSHAKVVDDSIIYYRYLQINKGLYPKEEFNDFRDFLESVSTADNAKTVLIPKT
ncbi:MAG: DUF3857 domain-containing protein [Carboxylicivirga sp.]|jgi:hypothetical protein|nr:DUF3857 domain-containing protein [Carboxylicivirga sp.]